MKLNHFICPTCGHDFYAEGVCVACDACNTNFYASQSRTSKQISSYEVPTQIGGFIFKSFGKELRKQY